MIFYFYGVNNYAIKNQVDIIRQKYLEKTGDDADLLQIDLSETGLAGLLANLQAMPMFVSSRLIIASNIALAKPTEEQLNELVEMTPSSTNLVLVDTKVDKRTVVFKKLSKLKHAKEFKQLTRPQLMNWLKQQAKLADLVIDENDLQHLIDRAGEDQWKLHNNIVKLASYGGKITKELIAELVSPSLESSAFDLAEALVAKKLKRVLKLYEQLKLDGQADPAILGAIIYQYRMILLSIVNSNELNKTYKASPYALQKARQIGKDLELVDIKYVYQQLREADMSTKSGKFSSEEAMKRLFYNLCVRQT